MEPRESCDFVRKKDTKDTERDPGKDDLWKQKQDVFSHIQNEDFLSFFKRQRDERRRRPMREERSNKRA